MNAIGFLLIFILFLVAKAEHNKRLKRGLAFYEFGKMIECATGRSPWDYNGYGCWCNRAGSGTPDDATDRCCKELYSCYDTLVHCSSGAWWSTSYNREGCSGCASSNSPCGQERCNCDQKAAECFSSASFSTHYKAYDKSQC